MITVIENLDDMVSHKQATCCHHVLDGDSDDGLFFFLGFSEKLQNNASNTILELPFGKQTINMCPNYIATSHIDYKLNYKVNNRV